MTEARNRHWNLRSIIQAGAADLTSTVEPSVPAAPTPAVEPEEEASEFSPSSESLHQSLPANCALLAVTEDHEPRHFRLSFYFEGENRTSNDDDVRAQEAINLTLQQIAERRKWKQDHDELRNWWRELAGLRRWMQQLVRVPGIRLIVWDNTGYQLPWELYYLDKTDPQRPYGWLGATIEVVRWTSLLESGRQARYTAVPAQASGGVVLLETDNITARNDGVATMVRSYRPAQLGRNPYPLPTVDALTRELSNRELLFGLLLVHCHGINATNANEFRLAERTLNEIEQYEMAALDRSKAVVILNACNTAKLVPVGPHATRATRSFAEMFLRKGASSVIATLGQVAVDHTVEFTFRLFEAATGQRISKILLDHRKRYADRLADPHRGDAKYEQFFYCFMYVCFGDPETTLKLTESPLDGAA
jgi:CHAT domain